MYCEIFLTMFSRISLRMETSNKSGDMNTQTTSEEGLPSNSVEKQSNPIEGRDKTPKRGSEQMGEGLPSNPGTSTDQDDEGPSRKRGSFELSENNAEYTWELEEGLADYANKYMDKFISNQTIFNDVTSFNPVPDNVKKSKLLDSYLKELLAEQEKHISLSQNKMLGNLHQRINFVYGPLSRIWAAMEAERNVSIADGEENNMLMEISNLFDQVILLLGQAMNSCAYIRRFNILMAFLGDKKKVDNMLKDNASAFTDTNDLLFGPKYEELVAKTLSSKSKSKELFNACKSPNSRDGIRRQPFRRNPLSNQRGNRGRGSFAAANQFIQQSSGYTNTRGKNDFTFNESQLPGPPVNNGVSKNSSIDSYSFSNSNKTTALCRKGKIFCGKLEKINKRPKDFRNCERLRNPFLRAAKTIGSTKTNLLKRKGNQTSRSGGPGNAKKGGYYNSKGVRRTICKLIVSSGKKGWGESPGYQLKESEQDRSLPALQNGGSFSPQGNVVTWGQNVQNRFARRILCNSSIKEIKKVYQISVEGPPIRVLLPLFRTFIGSSYFYKAIKDSNLSLEKAQCQNYNLPRRHVINGNHSGRSFDSKGHTDIPVTTLRVLDQHQKVSSGTDIDFRISGCDSRFHKYDIEPSQGKSCKNKGPMHRNAEQKQGHNKRIKQADRQTFIHCDSSPPSPPSVSATPKSTNSGTNSAKEFRGGGRDLKDSKGGTAVVEGKFVSLQREVSNFSKASNDNKFRCVATRLGCQLPGPDNGGTMVPGGKKISYKHLRIKGSETSYNDIYNTGEKRNFDTHSHGQHGSFVIPYENGGHQKPRIDCSKQGDMGIPIGTGDHNYCRIPTGVNEYSGGQGVQTGQGLERMETKTESIQKIMPIKGNPGHRFVCIKGVTPTTSIYGMESRSFQSGKGCFSSQVDSQIRVCFPTICTDWKNSPKGETGSMFDANSYTSMARPTMVPKFAKNVSEKSSTSPFIQRSFEGPSRERTPSNPEQLTPLSGMDHLRQNLLAEGLSKRSSDLITNSRRMSSVKHYESAWKKWGSWCAKREISPTRCNISFVLDFLAELFETGLQYSTIGNYRSAISAFHDPINGRAVGSHPRISSLMTGVFNKIPPIPKQPFIWDVETVLDYLRKLPCNDMLSDKLLTLKTSILLAILSASRVSEITNLNTEYLTKSPSVYIFAVAHLTKTCKKDKKPHPNFKFYSFPHEEKLCVCRAIDSYMKRRLAWGVKETQLLVSHISPHQPVCSSTVSRWLVQLLSMAGVNTEMFKGHSTRSASTSKAEAIGVSLTDVIKQGHWSNSSTFAKFYKKNIADYHSNFQSGILNNRL